VVYGGELGTPRVYQISDNQNRGQGNTKRDANLIREFERQPSPIHAVAWSPGGSRIVVGGNGEARVYSVSDGKRTATLKGNEGAIFAVAFHPTNNQVATGGYNGDLRIFDSISGNLVTNFIPVTITTAKQVAESRIRN
jgi:WD40 repeat protein